MMVTTPLWRLSARAIVKRVRAGEVSVREVVEAVLARLDDVNPRINAVPEPLHDAALASASQKDRALAAGKEEDGCLLGVPVTVKPNVDMAGHVTHLGSPAFTHVAREDSYAVAGLRRAGAVIIGRSNMPEFGMRWTTDSPLHGATLNPWNPAIVPGGSTGGGAAAVATGIGAIAHGNDLGGSLRQPAACCGVAAIRPTAGRIPYRSLDSYPSADAQLMGVDGPVARTICDAWLGLRGMACGGSAEPLAAPVPLKRATHDTSLRVVVVVDPDGDGVDPAVAESVRRAADVLADAGHEVDERPVPAIGPMAAVRNDLVWAKIPFAMAPHRAKSSDAINAVWDSMVRATNDVDLGGYLELLSVRAAHMREWDRYLQDVDIVLGPVSTEPPFEVGMDTGSFERFTGVLHALRLLLGLVLTGLPVAVVSAGLSTSMAPLGVQLVGARWREDRCVVAAACVEAELGLFTPIDPLPVRAPSSTVTSVQRRHPDLH